MHSVAVNLTSLHHHRLCHLQEGFAVRQGHLAPPSLTPDSPRPKNAPETNPVASLLIPTDKTKDGQRK
ncbi:unnamed protein product [Bursaphelenchus xylophilus]|uniref:(pine wood nematode) hypothetical protein n=1 Tax=Bursaphelenchus xylophilus TaxID=6326 RepID=A0A1I7RQ76_BURXY|nr:unnamed protein product [Bursaphelenchus xylophilus]CAG9097272.1 unnamed protein product [Bursaphelenchus xylophilus]